MANAAGTHVADGALIAVRAGITDRAGLASSRPAAERTSRTAAGVAETSAEATKAAGHAAVARTDACTGAAGSALIAKAAGGAEAAGIAAHITKPKRATGSGAEAAEFA